MRNPWGRMKNWYLVRVRGAAGKFGRVHSLKLMADEGRWEKD